MDKTIPKITPHDLRHAAASLAVSSGANVEVVQRMLGHASAPMTPDVYADLFDRDLDAVAADMSAARKAAASVESVGKVRADTRNAPGERLIASSRRGRSSCQIITV